MKKLTLLIHTFFLTFFLTAPHIQANTQAKEVLHLLSWPDYIDPSMISTFEEKYNVTVNISHYESESEREQQLSQGQGSVDLVLLSEPYLPIYKQLGWIEALDRSQLTSFKHIDPRWRDQTHGIGYMWGVTGIAYRKDRLASAPTSWTLFIDPPKELIGKIALFDDPKEVAFALALSQNIKFSDLEPKDIAQLYQASNNLKDISFYNSVLDETSPLVQDTIWAAQAYNGDIGFLSKEYDGNIDFVIPDEGCEIWTDYWSILSSSKKKALAYTFLNHINQPKVAAQNTNYLAYATTNAAAIPLLDESLKTNTIVFPKEGSLKHCLPYTQKKAAVDRAIHSQFSKMKGMRNR